MSFPFLHLTTFCNLNPIITCNMARYHDTPTRSAAKDPVYRQKYSLYQPVNGKTNRKSSTSKHGDKAQREREALRASAEAQSSASRRRATMRSKEHDEEEEAIRRAIEESKRDNPGSGTGKRGGKRVRDVDSEE